MTKSKNRGLGRGLSALMADINDPGAGENQNPSFNRAESTIPIERIHPNPDQPRRVFTQEALEELAASVREKGIIQPLILRPDPETPEHYQIVAGERRWRAAQMAQLHELPAIIRDFNDTEVLEVAIIENIQRADLNPIEEAAGYRQLMNRFDHTQERLAEAMGKSRSHIANLMRLLSLPDEVQSLVQQGKISAGHARALIGRDDAESLAREVAAKGLSVRDIENRVRQAKPGRRQEKVSPRKDADTVALEKDLSAAIGMRVQINYQQESGAGNLTVHYKDLAQLDSLLRRLNGDF